MVTNDLHNNNMYYFQSKKKHFIYSVYNCVNNECALFYYINSDSELESGVLEKGCSKDKVFPFLYGLCTTFGVLTVVFISLCVLQTYRLRQQTAFLKKGM